MSRRAYLTIVGVLALLVAVASFVMPPWHLGYRGEEPVGIYRLRAVTFDSDPTGNLVVHERLGGPLFALQLATKGAPWMTDCASGPCD